MEYDEVKAILSEKTGLPKTVVNTILDLLGPLLVLLALRELLEPLDLEPPLAQLAPICLTLALYWLVLVHYLSGKPLWLSVVTGLLLFATAVAFYKLWILYHINEAGHPIYLRVPLLVFACALLVHIVLQQQGATGLAGWFANRGFVQWRIAQPLGRLFRHYATATPAVWAPQGARTIGLGVFSVLLVACIWRPDAWYLIADTLLARHVTAGKIGILLAPYDKDENDQARSRLREDLTQLLGKTSELTHQVELLQLPRPVPGYADNLAEQTEAAQTIGRYDGGSVVAYGSTTGEYSDYLVKTRIALAEPFPFLEETLTVPRIVDGPPTNDARVVHMDALMIAGATSFLLGHCVAAEKLLTEASEMQREIMVQKPGAEWTPQANQIALVTANSIGCQVLAGVAKADQADDALRLLDGILASPQANPDLRLAAANSKAFIYRGLAGLRDDQAIRRRDLQAAVDALTGVLKAPATAVDLYDLAVAWQGLGVTEDLLERTMDPQDKPARRQSLANALQAYRKAEEFLQEAGSTTTAANAADRKLLSAAIAANEAVVMFRNGLIDNNPDVIAATIPIYQQALQTLVGTRHEVSVRGDLGDAYYVLSFYQDRDSNLTKARAEFQLSLQEEKAIAGPSILADIVGKLGNTDVALARAGNAPSAEASGIINLACSATLFRMAGLEPSAQAMEAKLEAEKTRIGADAYNIVLQFTPPPPVKACEGKLH